MCDDITFCPHADCDLKSCIRNQANVRHPQYPHSFSVGTPEDCPKMSCDLPDNIIDELISIGETDYMPAAEIEEAIRKYEKYKKEKEQNE